MADVGVVGGVRGIEGLTIIGGIAITDDIAFVGGVGDLERLGDGDGAKKEKGEKLADVIAVGIVRGRG